MLLNPLDQVEADILKEMQDSKPDPDLVREALDRVCAALSTLNTPNQRVRVLKATIAILDLEEVF